MIATSGFLTALNCTKFVLGRGSTADPAGGAYSAPPDPLAGLRDPTSKRGEERGGEGRKKREGCANEPSHFSERTDASESKWGIVWKICGALLCLNTVAQLPDCLRTQTCHHLHVSIPVLPQPGKSPVVYLETDQPFCSLVDFFGILQ